MPIPLVERSDRELARRVRRSVESFPEVVDCEEVTVGFTRKKPNIYFHVLLRRNLNFEEIHKVCSKVDREVRSLVPNARVVIHSEPVDLRESKDLWKLVKKVAEGEPGSRGVQNIHLRKIDGTIGVDLTLQVSKQLLRKQGEDFDARVTQKLKSSDPRIAEVIVHKESVPYLVLSEQSGHGTELRSYIEHVAKRFPELEWLSPPTIRRMNDGLHLTDRVAFTPGTSDDRASQIVSELGAAIRKGIPTITRAEIIPEPNVLAEM
jgi:divalent metal cation (Fe/Co/Zn/Cd) transporter